MPFYTWSQTSASNASADPSINFAEGQAPSSLNDSSRAMMTALKKWGDDITGAIVTGGSSTAYTVTSNSVFDTLAHLNGQMIAFTPHTTNGATVTLNVDGLGAKPLRAFVGVELQSNSLISGTPYLAIYNSSDAAFYLHGNAGGTYGVPLGAGMDFWLPTAPSSAFVFPTGQAISRTTYATLYAAMGTTYGSGDGSTTFNLPDKTERVSVMKATVASRLTTGASGVDGGTLGATGGIQNRTISQANLPNVTLSYSNSISVTSTPTNVVTGSVVQSHEGAGGVLASLSAAGASQSAITSTGTSSGNTASINGGVTQTSLITVQPTIVCNYILRII